MYILWCKCSRSRLKSQLSLRGHRGSSGSQAARRAAGGGGQKSGEGLVIFFSWISGRFSGFLRVFPIFGRFYWDVWEFSYVFFMFFFCEFSCFFSMRFCSFIFFWEMFFKGQILLIAQGWCDGDFCWWVDCWLVDGKVSTFRPQGKLWTRCWRKMPLAYNSSMLEIAQWVSKWRSSGKLT